MLTRRLAGLGDIILRRRLGRAAALAAILAGSALYTAEANRAVLGRYSPLFAAWLALLVVALAAAVAGSVLAPRREAGRAGAVLAEAAWACTGLGYLASALLERRFGARALNLNFFGSPFAASAALESAALCLLAATAILAAMRRVRGRGRDVLLLAGSLAAVALVGELGARIAAFVRPDTHGIPSLSDQIFWRRYVRLNGAGFRDTEHALAPAPGTRRLLLVGDSYAFGAGLRRTADRFGEQLATALAARSGRPWEVINNSVLDRTTLEEIEFLRQGLAYRPDVVILLYVFNDADYLAGELPEGVAVPGVRRPPGKALFDPPRSLLARFEPTRVLYANSFAFQELYARWRLVRYGFARQPTAGAASGVYHAPPLLARHLADLQRFVDLARAANALVAIVPIDPGAAAEPALRARYRTFTDAAAGAGLPVWSLLDVYEGRALKDITVSTLDSHPNALGYRLAVEAVAPRIVLAVRERP